MDDTQTLQLVGILPLLADEVFAEADVHLRLHYGGRALAAGDDISVAKARGAGTGACPAAHACL